MRGADHPVQPRGPAHCIRPARGEDLDALLALCAEHAAFERTPYDPRGHLPRLRAALFDVKPRLCAWVAVGKNDLTGYATAAEEFSTWRAAAYLHMDCLFVRAGSRGFGLGASLLAAVVDHARARRLQEVQWQTPHWNLDARRFYGRHHAAASAKTRFTLTL